MAPGSFSSLLQDTSQSSGKEPGQDGSSSSSNGATARAGSEEEGAKPSEGESREYEFTGGETQLLRICMDTMHMAGLALIVQGMGTGLLGAPSSHQLARTHLIYLVTHQFITPSAATMG